MMRAAKCRVTWDDAVRDADRKRDRAGGREHPASYRDRLGFIVAVYEEEPEHYGTAQRANSHVHFAHEDGVRGRPNYEVIPPDMFDAYFWPDDVDALHTELADRGATIIQTPTDQPYGLRDFRVQDPDGYIRAFGKRVS